MMSEERAPYGEDGYPALTGAHYHRMSRLGRCETLDGVEEAETLLARLTLLAEGHDPADPMLLHQLLDSALPEYMERIAPVMRQLDDAPEITLRADGGYDVGEYHVEQLRGYHRRLLASLGDIAQERSILGPMTGLTPEDLDAMPIGTYQALARACGFLVSEAMTPISQRSSD